MKDQWNREIDYVRISITDRCNLRCQYCMPNGVQSVAVNEMLTYEEILEIVKQLVCLGIKKVKITGGEPLIRKGCCRFLKKLKEIEGICSVTLTTNGTLLKQYYQEIIESRIDGINISLDTLNPIKYKEITGSNEIQNVLEGIELFKRSGIPIKINVVSLNLDVETVFSLIELARNDSIDVRFIEMMPIGLAQKMKAWNHINLQQEIQKKYDLTFNASKKGNGPAMYYTIPGFKGNIGFISAIHGKFCDSCNRIRIASTGDLKGCLSYPARVNLKAALQKKKNIVPMLKECIFYKPKSHSFETKVEETNNMNAIGG